MKKKHITRKNNVEKNPTIFERLKISPLDFSLEIERIVFKNKMSYIDAILKYCDENEVDIDRVKSLVNPTLKEKIKAEAIKLHTIKQ